MLSPDVEKFLSVKWKHLPTDVEKRNSSNLKPPPNSAKERSLSRNSGSLKPKKKLMVSFLMTFENTRITAAIINQDNHVEQIVVQPSQGKFIITFIHPFVRPFLAMIT
jgi:hypothetical protein